MNRSQELLKNADNCVELAKAANREPEKKRFERLAEGWKNVAEAQAWLDGEPDPGPKAA
jgi:hypothetical protein